MPPPGADYISIQRSNTPPLGLAPENARLIALEKATTMRKLLSALALTGLLGFTSCTDGYGRHDPLATGLLAAGVVGTGVALAVASNNQPRHSYGYSQPHFSRSGHGFGRPGHGWQGQGWHGQGWQGHGWQGHGYGRSSHGWSGHGYHQQRHRAW